MARQGGLQFVAGGFGQLTAPGRQLKQALVDEHVAEGLASVAAMGNDEEEDVPAKRPGGPGAQIDIDDWDNIDLIIAPARSRPLR